jgi:hypothetical protein
MEWQKSYQKWVEQAPPPNTREVIWEDRFSNKYRQVADMSLEQHYSPPAGSNAAEYMPGNLLHGRRECSSSQPRAP